MQNIYFYIDDSGVFHHKGDRYTIFAGYVFYSKKDKDNAERLFHSLEKKIKIDLGKSPDHELKSYGLDSKYKRRLYSILNNFHRFSCVIDNTKIEENIWSHKKHKQRFLDYALKRQIKETINTGFKENYISRDKITHVNIFFDEHTTATSGLYELSEGIKEELVHGTFNFKYSIHFPPILKKDSTVNLTYANSKNVTLVRAADNVANRVYHELNVLKKDVYDLRKRLNHHCTRKFP